MSSSQAPREGRRTMPPPELLERAAPASVGALVLDQLRAEAPMPRHNGPRAEEAHLRAQVTESREAGDLEAEREASITLARLLASRGRDLGSATRLATRALEIQDDRGLRTELAGWLAGLGETAAAAQVLRDLSRESPPAEVARTLVKIAVLLARAEQAGAAAEALDESADRDPKDAMAIELFGTIAAWAPETVSAVSAASAYLQAAARREAAGEKEAAFEDRLRAFEMAPMVTDVAEETAAAMMTKGRDAAADEVMRIHAASLTDPQAARAIDRRRMLSALKDGDAARAMGALLDAGLEVEIDGPDAAKVDEALTQAGLFEILAARLELRAEREAGPARAETLQVLAKLFAGPLASPERSVETWIEAAAADPASPTARVALRDNAGKLHDTSALVEGLIRIGLAKAEGNGERAAALRELFTLANDRLDDASLATWALDAGAATGGSAEVLSAEKQALLPRIRRQDAELTEAKKALEDADSPDAKVKALRRIVTVYQGRPAEAEALRRALTDLGKLLPGDRATLVALERVAHRTGDFAELEEAYRDRIKAGAPARALAAQALLGLATIERKRGDDGKALDAMLPLLEESGGNRAAASVGLLLAARAGRPKERAAAIVELAGPAWPALRATLFAVAARIQSREGLAAVARRTAEQGCEADPTCARALTTLADVAGASSDRLGAAALERAMTNVLPRGVWCQLLAKAFDALGEGPLALAWTQRWLALRPGSGEAVAQLLLRAARSGDAARMGDALGWVLAQPRPLAEFTDATSAVLNALLDLDRQKARQLARRTLDVVGPRVPMLRRRLLELADRAGDPGLGIAVLERYLATEGQAAHAGELLLELARRRTSAGDYEGASREVARAAGVGDAAAALAEAERLESEMRAVGAWLGSDGLCALAEAKALGLEASGPEAATAAAIAFRELGSLRWDLAGDKRGAEAAFYRASEISPRGGIERYSRDLTAFGGLDAAFAALEARARREGTPGKERAHLLIEAANLATEHGMPERALTSAASAIDADPARADAVALVEKNAHLPGGIELLDRAYRRLAAAALGCYGRRAAHYRGARQLERRGAVDLALSHAAACFEAVPAEGTSYVLLQRLAERSGDPTEAVQALRRVAESGKPEGRPGWLKRAAALAGSSEEGVRTRFDLLLEALNVRPDPGTVADVAAAIREVVRLSREPDAVRELVGLRFERALKASLKKLDGPDGARTAVAMAKLAFQLESPDTGFLAARRAMSVDGDVDEFASLAEVVPQITADREAGLAWLEAVRAEAEKPYTNLGIELLKLAGEVAGELGDTRARAAFLLRALEKSTDDDALAELVHLAVLEAGDPELEQRLDRVLPPAERAQGWVRLAEDRERDGLEAEAIASLQRAVDSGLLEGDEKDRATSRLQRLLGQVGRVDDAETLLRAQLGRLDLSSGARARVAHDLADLLVARGDKAEALDVLAAFAARSGADAETLAEMRGLARATGELERYVGALEAMAGTAPSDAGRLSVLHELAPLLDELGDPAGALAAYEAIAALDPTDLPALEILERHANEQGDHEAIASLLGRRIELSNDADRRRMLRLRRAAVLEQRLGRLDEAAQELEALLEETPGDLSAMRFLADLHERIGSPLKAAVLHGKLGELSASSEEKAEYGTRATAAYLSAGEADAAEALLDDIQGLLAPESVSEIRVEIARKRGDKKGLAEALESLSASSREAPERRAAMLVESARAAADAGDDGAALGRVRRALELTPGAPDAVLEARRLEYRLGGTGTPREAQAVASDLAAIEGRIDPSQVALHAFLLAEALDVIQGGGAGMRELTKRHAELGPLPLIALGMAERMVRLKSFEAALPLFEHAIAGDLEGLRTRGRVALSAAQAAVSARAHGAAERLLAVAAAEPDTADAARKKQLELTGATGKAREARAALEELSRITTGLDKSRALLSLGKLVAAEDPSASAAILDEALTLAKAHRSLSAEIAEARAKILGTEEAESDPAPIPLVKAAAKPAPKPVEKPMALPPPLPVPTMPMAGRVAASPPQALPPPLPVPTLPSSKLPAVATPAPTPAPEPVKPPAPEPVAVALEPKIVVTPPPFPVPAAAEKPAPPAPKAVEAPPEKPASVAPPKPIEAPPERPASVAPPKLASVPPPKPVEAQTAPRPSSVPPPPAATEADLPRLEAELAAGSFAAGNAIAEIHAAAGGRSREILTVRRRQAEIELGDQKALRALVQAAIHDGNAVYARAVEHAARGLDKNCPAPPPLSAQRFAPDQVARLLFRPIAESPVHEALALIVETGLYKRDVNAYQLAGVARILPGTTTALSDTFATVGRFLGLTKTSLFHPKSPPGAPIATKIALLTPPAIVLTGDARDDTAELRYAIGAALAGAMPEHALVNGLGEEQLSTLLDGLLAAFGPVSQLPRSSPAVAKLSQNLWQVVPPRADRRLRELCATPEAIRYEAAVAGTRQAMRRAGLFASGSVPVSLQLASAELGIPLEGYQAAPEGLALLAKDHAPLADLLALAIRPELADARWAAPQAPPTRRLDPPPMSQRWSPK